MEALETRAAGIGPEAWHAWHAWHGMACTECTGCMAHGSTGGPGQAANSCADGGGCCPCRVADVAALGKDHQEMPEVWGPQHEESMGQCQVIPEKMYVNVES